MPIKPIFTSLTRRKTQTVLLVLQLTVTFALMINSLMLALDASSKLTKNTGMKLDELIVAAYKPNHNDYKERAWFNALVEKDIAQLTTVDGVKSITLSNQPPLAQGGLSVDIHGIDQPQRANLRSVSLYQVDTNVIDTLGLSLSAGRNFNETDLRPSQPISEASPIIITQALADLLFPNSNPVGQLTSQGQIIGVVKKFHGLQIGGPNAIEYSIFSPNRVLSKGKTTYMLIRVNPKQLNGVAAKLPSLLRTNNLHRTIYQVEKMRDNHRQLYQQEMAIAALFSILSFFMLLITLTSAFIHAYHHVTQQTKILAIWRALGASQRDVMFYILGENWMMTGLSVMLGVFAAYVMNTFLNQYIAVDKPDWVLLAGVALLMLFAGSLASWLPAAKAARVSPAAASRA